MEEYISMKIPRNVRIGAEMAKAKLMTEGKEALKKIPEGVLNPTKCPICTGEMEKVEVRARIGYKKCEKCGYSQPFLDISTVVTTGIASLLAAIGLGALLGLGIAALLALIGT